MGAGPSASAAYVFQEKEEHMIHDVAMNIDAGVSAYRKYARRACKGAASGADALAPYLKRLDPDTVSGFVAEALAVVQAWQRTADQLETQTKKRPKVTAPAAKFRTCTH
jgi:hypothetical protein